MAKRNNMLSGKTEAGRTGRKVCSRKSDKRNCIPWGIWWMEKKHEFYRYPPPIISLFGVIKEEA